MQPDQRALRALILAIFLERLLEDQQQLDQESAQVINDHFWDMYEEI